MLINERRKNIKAAQPEKSKADLSLVFSAPKDYTNGNRKKLRDRHAGDWWLNVDYVVVETALA